MAKVVFYSFSQTILFFKEFSKFFEEYKFIIPRGNYLYLLEKNEYLYLYDKFEKYLQKNIDFNLKKDNIYKILEGDKNENYNEGYKSLDKEEQLKLVKTIYYIYKNFLLEYKPDFVIFPDVETVDGNILINICYELGIEVVYFVHMRQLGKSFFSNSLYETLPCYFGNYTKKDLDLAKDFIDNFFELSSRNLIHNWNNEKIDIQLPSLISRTITSIKLLNKEKYFYGEGKTLSYKIRTNLIKYVEIYRNFRYEKFHKKYFDLKDNKDLEKLPKNFILFALQVTPESSINSLEPYFIDQLRAIDLIRLNMPNDFYIVVKEHPSMRGIRDVKFYKELRKKAGVILVTSEISTKEVMKKAKLISTITGTIALESFMMNKPALMFGPTFFSHLVYRYDSFLDFKQDLYNMIFNHKPLSKEEKMIEIAKLYNIGYSMILFDPIADPIVMNKNNIKSYYEAFLNHIKRLKKCNNV